MNSKKKTETDLNGVTGALMAPVETKSRKPLHNNSGSIMGFRADDETKALYQQWADETGLSLSNLLRVALEVARRNQIARAEVDKYITEYNQALEKVQAVRANLGLPPIN